MSNRSARWSWKWISWTRKGVSLLIIARQDENRLLASSTTTDPYDTDKMAVEFLQQFTDHAFSVGQYVSERSLRTMLFQRHVSFPLQLPFQFMDKKTLTLAVKDLECKHRSSTAGLIPCFSCWFIGDCARPKLQSTKDSSGCDTSKHDGDLRTSRRFRDQPSRQIERVSQIPGSLVDADRWIQSRKTQFVSIINPDFDFKTMGIGGLDNEFNAIFRRAFASRVFPPEVVYQLGKFWPTDVRRGIQLCLILRHETLSRDTFVRSTGYWQNTHGSVSRLRWTVGFH